MERLEWTEVHGKTVLKQDFSHLEHLDIMRLMDKSHEEIEARGEKGIIVVTNLKDVVFDHQVVKHFCKICESNKPYVGASAIFNAGNVQKAAIESAAHLSNRDFLMFYDDKAIQKWLDSL